MTIQQKGLTNEERRKKQKEERDRANAALIASLGLGKNKRGTTGTPGGTASPG